MRSRDLTRTSSEAPSYKLSAQKPSLPRIYSELNLV